LILQKGQVKYVLSAKVPSGNRKKYGSSPAAFSLVFNVSQLKELVLWWNSI